MRSTISLIRLLAGDMISRYSQQTNMARHWTLALFMTLFAMMLLPIINLSNTLHEAFAAMGHSELAITSAVVASSVMLLTTAIPMFLSLFFFSKDMGLLSTLPLTVKQVITAKSAVIYLYLVAFTFYLLMPSLVIYSLIEQFRPLAFMMGVLAFLVLPIYPMIISALLTMPLMKLIGKTKRRGMWFLIGNLVLLVLIFGSQILFVRLQSSTTQMEALLVSETNLINQVGQRFWPSIWLTKMLLGDAVSGVLFFISTMLIALSVMVVAKWLYRGAMQAYSEVSATGVKSGEAAKNGFLGQNKSVFVRLIWRHIAIFLGNSTFLFQLGISMFLPTIILGVNMAAGDLSLDVFRGPMAMARNPYIFTGLMIGPAMMASLSATVITREGKAFWETLVMPISHHENLKSRIWSSNLLCCFAIVIQGGIGLWLLPMAPLDALLAVVLALLATHLLNTVDLYINVARPILNWVNPTAAVKNNLNLLFAFAYRLALGLAGYVALGVLPLKTFKGDALVVICLLVIGYGIQQVVFYPKLLENFRKMEW